MKDYPTSTSAYLKVKRQQEYLTSTVCEICPTIPTFCYEKEPVIEDGKNIPEKIIKENIVLKKLKSFWENLKEEN